MQQNTHAKKSGPVAEPAETFRPLVRAEVIAKLFSVHPRTVALWAQNETIPSYRIGSALRFDLTEIEAAIGRRGKEGGR